jgi:hypothetical protein
MVAECDLVAGSVVSLVRSGELAEEFLHVDVVVHGFPLLRLPTLFDEVEDALFRLWPDSAATPKPLNECFIACSSPSEGLGVNPSLGYELLDGGNQRRHAGETSTQLSITQALKTNTETSK